MFFRVLESRDYFRSNYPWGNGATRVSIGTLRNIKNCLDEFERRTWSFYRHPFVVHGDMFSDFFLAAPQKCAEISPKKQVTFERSSDLFFWGKVNSNENVDVATLNFQST